MSSIMSTTLVPNTLPPGSVYRRRLPLSRIPKLGSHLSIPSVLVHKCTVPSDTWVRKPDLVQCSAAEYAEMVPPKDVGTKTAGEGMLQGTRCTVHDVLTVGLALLSHGLTLLAPFYFTWGALWVGVGLGCVTGLFGITLSYHRNLSHRSFNLPKWLEYTFAYCGVLAGQRDPIDWVSTHRYHHMYTDSDKDPHSPIHGFWFSHIAWAFDYNLMLQKRGGQTNVGDLECQPFYRFLQRTWVAHLLGLALLLYSIGGLPFLVWGMGVRLTAESHITFFINSVCHTWGNRAWNTGDFSKNNWVVAILTFGEGWHNNHHAFEYSARHGLEWWQVDMTWFVIRFLQAVGLATDVKLPRVDHKQRLALKLQQLELKQVSN